MALKEGPRWIIFLVWLAVLLVSLKAHTPWRDEYQSWLISTRAPSLAAFFEAVRYERHPPLHYVVQRAAVFAFPSLIEISPAVAVQLITVPFTVGAVFILIFGLGLTSVQAALMAFSPYVLREFGVISRAYALGLFFLMLATFFARRKRYSMAYAALAFGALTHLLFGWVCGAIYTLLAIEDRRRWRNASFWLAGFLFIGAAILQIPPPDTDFRSLPHFTPKTFFVALRGLNQSLWGLEKIWQPYQWNTMPLATDLTVLLFLPALFLVRRSVDLRKFFWVCYPPVLLVAAGSGLNTRSLGVSFVGFVASYALYRKRATALNIFGFTALLSTVMWWLAWAPFGPDPRFDFSAMRELVQHEDLSEAPFLIQSDAEYFTWMAEAKRTTFDVRRHRELAYPLFRKTEYIYKSFAEWCPKHLAEFKTSHPGAIYLGLLAGQSFPVECGAREPVFSTKRPILTNESPVVYRLR